MPAKYTIIPQHYFMFTYRIPKIQEKIDTSYPNSEKKKTIYLNDSEYSIAKPGRGGY